MASGLRYIPLSHTTSDSQASALRLIFTLFPEWEASEGEVRLTRFTDGITNTLLKAAKRRPGLSESEIDDTAVLLRAYGKGTEVLIDREKEKAYHLLLASYNLAPPLLARFQNGMIYRFIQGRVCSPADLRQEPVWRGVARRLGQWHSVLPIIPGGEAEEAEDGEDEIRISLSPSRKMPSLQEINAITPAKVTPNTWTVMQKWIFALPTNTEAEVKRKALLQQELERTVAEFDNLLGFGMEGLVVAHCDLLSGNVIMVEPRHSGTNGMPARTHYTPQKVNGKPTETNGAAVETNGTSDPAIKTVSFIDYEYATPSPAAFDLANHFAEWGGFDCDFSVLPTRSTRRAFLQEYLASYRSYLSPSSDTRGPSEEKDGDPQLDELFAAVDRFRGIPGFYWGIWALIQATISQIDFDYAAYAEIRLGEYWDWRAEADQSRKREGREMGVRERRWAED